MRGEKLSFYIGILILFFLAGSYFIKISVENGANYNVKSSLLGILIFHNPFVLVIYVLITVILIWLNLKNKNKRENVFTFNKRKTNTEKGKLLIPLFLK